MPGLRLSRRRRGGGGQGRPFWGYRGLHRELAIRQVTPEIGIAESRGAGGAVDRPYHLSMLDGPQAAIRPRTRLGLLVVRKLLHPVKAAVHEREVVDVH